MTRRNSLALSAFGVAAAAISGCNNNAAATDDDSLGKTDVTANTKQTASESLMQLHYLEIVTQQVDATCELHARIHGVTFGDPDPNLGGARTGKTNGNAIIGIRAPMHDGEKPVTRAYMLVKDIDVAVADAVKAGAEIAVPPMEIPGHGKCAVYFLGGIEAGFWQL
ncbi:MAG: hypothetical protein AAF539_10195 [Planctomycetota bacterium]